MWNNFFRPSLRAIVEKKLTHYAYPFSCELFFGCNVGSFAYLLAQVIISMGAYSCLSHAINAFLDEGDEVSGTVTLCIYILRVTTPPRCLPVLQCPYEISTPILLCIAPSFADHFD